MKPVSPVLTLLLGAIAWPCAASAAGPSFPDHTGFPADTISWWRGAARVDGAYVGSELSKSAHIEALCAPHFPVGIGRFDPAPQGGRRFIIGSGWYDLLAGQYELTVPLIDSCGVRVSTADVYVVRSDEDSVSFDVTLGVKAGTALSDSALRVSAGLIVGDGRGREVVRWFRPARSGRWVSKGYLSIPWSARPGDQVTVRTIIAAETFALATPADSLTPLECDRSAHTSHVAGELLFEKLINATVVSTRKPRPLPGCTIKAIYR